MEAVNSHLFKKSLLRILLLIALVVQPAVLFAQRSSNWRIYRASDGLQDSVCTGLSISPRGAIWIHHPDRSHVSWTDGYEVRKVAMPGLSASHIYEGRVGQIWSVYPNGVQEFKDGSWIRYPIKALVGKPDVPLLPLRQGQVLIETAEALISFTSEPSPETTIVRQAAVTGLGSFAAMIGSRDGGAWIAGKNGIGKFATVRALDAHTALQEYHFPPEFEADAATSLTEDDDGGVTAIVRSTRTNKKVPVHWDGRSWTVMPSSIADVTQAWQANDRTFWEVGPYSLVHLHNDGQRWRVEDELLAAQYYQVAVDHNGVFYVATSEGVYRYAPLIWQTTGPGDGTAGVLAVAPAVQARLWCVTPTMLHAFDGTDWASFPLPDALKNVASSNSVLQQLSPSTLLVGTANRPFVFDIKNARFTELQHPSGERLTFIGAVKDSAACFRVGSNSGDADIHLETYDGEQFKPMLSISTNVVGATINFLFLAQNGIVWIEGDRGLAYLSDGKWQKGEVASGAPQNVIMMLDFAPGKLWAATRERIVQFNGKDWSVVKSGFDRINNMFKGRDGSVWVANDNGVQRFYKGDWIANGFEEGLSSMAVRQVIEDSQGHLWAATARGLNSYHPDADTDPPEAAIQPVAPESISTDGNIILDFTARDRWKQTLPDRLLYSYRIDEQDWSPLQTERNVHFAELSGGKHFFQVRALDRNWNIDPKPALLEFFVPVPWFRETRLLLIGSAAGLAVLFFAGLAFNRHRQLVRSYAEVEKIVQVRTRELERANRELFQSQKMNALGTLAAGIAHDFNSILSIIKGSAQIIETNVENPEKIRTRVDRINTAVDQGAGIVKAMLGFSRSSDHQVTECNLNPVIQDTIRLLGDRFQRDVEVQFEPTENIPSVCVVKDFVQQIVLNFILNAAESMSGTGKIIVRTAMLHHMPTDMVLNPEPATRYALVAVQDFGCGITPENLSRIFDPFFTTKSLSAKRGTGLGLSMVYELAKEMKCGLHVVTEPGKGSTFTLVVPIIT